MRFFPSTAYDDQQLIAAIATLSQSDLMDEVWYWDRYRWYNDICDASWDYLDTGGQCLLDPGPNFSTGAYLEAYPELIEDWPAALLHYEMIGRAESRAIFPSDDVDRNHLRAARPLALQTPRVITRLLIQASAPTATFYEHVGNRLKRLKEAGSIALVQRFDHQGLHPFRFRNVIGRIDRFRPDIVLSIGSVTKSALIVEARHADTPILEFELAKFAPDTLDTVLAAAGWYLPDCTHYSLSNAA